MDDLADMMAAVATQETALGISLGETALRVQELAKVAAASGVSLTELQAGMESMLAGFRGPNLVLPPGVNGTLKDSTKAPEKLDMLPPVMVIDQPVGGVPPGLVERISDLFFAATHAGPSVYRLGDLYGPWPREMGTDKAPPVSRMQALEFE